MQTTVLALSLGAAAVVPGGFFVLACLWIRKRLRLRRERAAIKERAERSAALLEEARALTLAAAGSVDLQSYERLRVRVRELQRLGVLPTEPTHEQRVSFAYGQVDAIARKMPRC